MSRFLNTRLRGYTAYTPGEQPSEKEYIKLNTNESPFPPGPEVLKVLREDSDFFTASLKLYPDPKQSELRRDLARHFENEVPSLTEENILVSNGSDDILNFSFSAFSGKDALAVFPDISYGFYKVFAEFQGVNYETIPLNDDFAINPKDYYNLSDKYKKKVFIIIANPNAPTGRALSREDVKKILMENPESPVIIDEAYVDFGGETALSLIGDYDNLLVVRTYSKSMSLAGARLGYAVGNKALIEDLDLIKYSTNPYSVNRMTEAVGRAALKEANYYRRNCRKIEDIREWTSDELRKMGFTVIPSKANFVFTKNEKGMTGKELYECLKKEGILVRWFDSERIRDYLRISIGCEEEMEMLVNKLKEIVRS